MFLQAPAAETAESRGGPGIFSQVLSELTAPFYEEDEADFDSEDSSSVDPSLEDTSKEEGNNKNIHQDYPSSSENKEEEDKKEDNEDIASKHPSSEESSDKGNKDDNGINIPSVDSISEKNLRKEDKNKEVSPHTSSENKLDNYDHPSSLEENVDKSDSSSREITSDVAIRDEDDKKINEEPQFASSKYMSVSRDSCAFIQSCFPVDWETKEAKNIFLKYIWEFGC